MNENIDTFITFVFGFGTLISPSVIMQFNFSILFQTVLADAHGSGGAEELVWRMGRGDGG